MNVCGQEKKEEVSVEKNEQEEIRLWITDQEVQMKRDLAQLIGIPSVASEETDIPGAPFGAQCRRVLEKMREIGMREAFRCEDVDGYCLCLTAGAGMHEIGIWNHLDVVPEGDGWEYPPYECTEKNGYLIGRGVQDNKGPAIAVLYAMKYCSEHGWLRNIRVRQILGCQEESGMKDVEYYLSHYPAPEYSFVADCGFPVCCGEKGHYHITLQSMEKPEEFSDFSGGTVPNSVPSRAYAVLESGERVEADGIGGHAAFPDGTVNALHVLCDQLEKRGLMKKLSWKTQQLVSFLADASGDGYGEKIGIACEDEVSGRLTCNAGVARLENGYLTVQLDIRYPVTMKAEAFLEKLTDRAEKAGFSVTHTEDSAPYYMEKTHPFVELLMDAWREATKQEGKPFVMGGGTYARKIPRAVAFGPGQERDFSVPGLKEGHGNCHCADEAESIENIKHAAEIYIAALRKLDEAFQE